MCLERNVPDRGAGLQMLLFATQPPFPPRPSPSHSVSEESVCEVWIWHGFGALFGEWRQSGVGRIINGSLPGR